MKRNKLNIVAAVTIALVVGSFATAQAANTIVSWDWTADPAGPGPDPWPGGNAPVAFTTAQAPSYYTYASPYTPTLNSFTVPTGVTISSLSYGPGLSASDGSGADQAALTAFSSAGDGTLAGAINNNQYFTFTLQVSPGYTVNLSGLQLATGKYSFNNYGGTSYVYSSADNFTTALGSGSNGWIWNTFDQYRTDEAHGWSNFAHTVSPYTVDLSGQTGLQNLTQASGTVEFRIYVPISAWSGEVGAQKVQLDGTVAAIPEPATCALLLGAIGLLWPVLRRRR